MMLRFLFEGDERFRLVGEAEDGRAAIDVVAESRPDLVVLDLMMPRMSGLEALPHIRSTCPDARVVVLSALGAGDPRTDEALRLGAAACFSKASGLHNFVDVLANIP
jgi:DNA-binding NarL/FixJ family response regulator